MRVSGLALAGNPALPSSCHLCNVDSTMSTSSDHVLAYTKYHLHSR